VCSLSYLACEAYAQYYIVFCGLSGFTMFFPQDIIKNTIFGKTLLNLKCVLIFSTALLETYLFLIIIQPEIILSAHTSSCIVFVILGQILMKLEFFRHKNFWENHIKFYENPSSGSGVVSCGQTDRRMDGRTDMTKLIVGFVNFANAAILWYLHILSTFTSIVLSKASCPVYCPNIFTIHYCIVQIWGFTPVVVL
jgi:hypothetical protein